MADKDNNDCGLEIAPEPIVINSSAGIRNNIPEKLPYATPENNESANLANVLERVLKLHEKELASKNESEKQKAEIEERNNARKHELAKEDSKNNESAAQRNHTLFNNLLKFSVGSIILMVIVLIALMIFRSSGHISEDNFVSIIKFLFPSGFAFAGATGAPGIIAGILNLFKKIK